jgi:hypothetical protein
VPGISSDYDIMPIVNIQSVTTFFGKDLSNI